jgi:hypothetical protein
MTRRISRRHRPTMTPGLDQLESRQLLTGFQVVSSPTIAGAGLNAVSAVSPTDIWAIGDQSSGPTTLAENFNGTKWSAVATPNPSGSPFADLNGVSTLASNAVWAVGEDASGPVVEFFNGTSWSIQSASTTGGVLNAVTALSPTDVWAVGSTSIGTGSGHFIEHFDGTSWSVSLTTSANRASLTGISAVSPTDIFAIGSSKNTGGQLLHFDGTTWSTVATPSTGIPSEAVDAISDTDIWAVGGGISNFNGTTWTQFPPASGDLVSISGGSANNLFAVGETISTTDQPLVEQWNGSSWSVVADANPGGGVNSFSGVTTLGNGTAVAVGTVGIESNATTASPAFRPSASLPINAAGSPVTLTVQVPGLGVSPDGTAAPPESSPGQGPGGDELHGLQYLLRRANPDQPGMSRSSSGGTARAGATSPSWALASSRR